MKALLESVGDMIASGVSVEKRNINSEEIVNDLGCTYRSALVTYHPTNGIVRRLFGMNQGLAAINASDLVIWKTHH